MNDVNNIQALVISSRRKFIFHQSLTVLTNTSIASVTKYEVYFMCFSSLYYKITEKLQIITHKFQFVRICLGAFSAHKCIQLFMLIDGLFKLSEFLLNNSKLTQFLKMKGLN